MNHSQKKQNILATWPPMIEEVRIELDSKVNLCITEPNPSSKDIAQLAKEKSISAMIVRQGKITREVLTASPDLKVISKHGVGIDNIDIDAATELGIPVCITPDANYNSVAELVFCMMMVLVRNLFIHNQRVKKGIWDKVSDTGMELQGKCLGIIGLGKIGQQLARFMSPHQVKVISYDPFVKPTDIPEFIEVVDTKETLLQQADFISIHCPKTPDTIGMIGEKEFNIMKSNAVLINASRGGLVDESALIQALRSGTIKGAGLDCFEHEPVTSSNPLLQYQEQNLIMTPHIGGATKDALIRMGKEAADNVLSHLEGKILPMNVLVNPEVLNTNSKN